MSSYDEARCLTDHGRAAGFTLIELLIVVVIIGILAAIAIPEFASTKGKAFDASAKSDLRNLMTAEEAYYFEYSDYTGVVTDLRSDGFRTSPGVTVSLQKGSGFYKADASHQSSNACFRVAYGSGQMGEIQRVPNASSGSGDCSG